MDRGSQWAWLEMGGCHSKKVVIPDFETPGRGSMSSRSVCRSMFGSCQSDIRPQTRTSEDLPVNRQTAAFTLEQLEHLETCLKEAEEKANALLEQLTASEEAKLQLLEKVSLLEERLQAVSQRSAGGESYENMVLEKDKCIEKLQAEVKASQEKLTAHYQAVLESVIDGGLGNKLSDIGISKSMVMSVIGKTVQELKNGLKQKPQLLLSFGDAMSY